MAKIVLVLFGLLMLGLVGLVVLGALAAPEPAKDIGNPSSSDEYQNEGYETPKPARKPPPLPQPETYDEATEWLKKNPFYKQTVPAPVRCEVPAIDPRRISSNDLEAHLNQEMACLMKVWTPPVEAAGFKLPRPTVTVYSGSVNTACGKAKSKNAFYCAADQRVYFADNLVSVWPAQYTKYRMIMETVLAHEFGHALQARTGLLISGQAWVHKLGEDSTEGLRMSRRIEVQADCFAGQWIRSISQSNQLSYDDLRRLMKVMDSMGDDNLSGDPAIVGNHGLGQSRKYWFAEGLNNFQLSTCNTYVVDKKLVR